MNKIIVIKYYLHLFNCAHPSILVNIILFYIQDTTEKWEIGGQCFYHTDDQWQICAKDLDLVIPICPSFQETVLAYLGCQLKTLNKTQGQAQLMSTIPRATSDGRQGKLS